MRRAPLLMVLTAAVLLGGCQDMQFRLDHRIEVQSPGNFAKVREPLSVRWTARDFNPPSDGMFAVFVDRDPMPPGKTMDYFSDKDRNHIWVVDTPSLTVDSLPGKPGVNDIERNHHDVTIVLLDASGKRIGETAGFAEFDITK